MIGSGALGWVVDRITKDPAILCLGDLDFVRVLPSRGASDASVLLRDPVESVLYVVDVQLGPTDDRHIIKLVERWATESNRHGSGRCYAVLVAEGIPPRYLNFLRVISRAVPLRAIEMRMSKAVNATTLRFAPARLRLR